MLTERRPITECIPWPSLRQLYLPAEGIDLIPSLTNISIHLREVDGHLRKKPSSEVHRFKKKNAADDKLSR